MKCCICGTIKNCGQYLDKIFENMKIMGELFEDYAIILFYDNSTDNTLEKLKSNQLNNNKIIFYVNKNNISNKRTFRLAYGRNYCLDVVRKLYKDYEYVIMMDCDDVCARDFKSELLVEYLNRNDWDALSFNHPIGYYDWWALSKRPLVFSCHHFVNGGSQWKTYIDNVISKTNENDLIPCFSAFNGFAIYRIEKFENCVYDGSVIESLKCIPKELLNNNIRVSGKIVIKTKEYMYEDCEHRPFHFQAVLKNNARIRISPKCLFK